MALSNLFGWAKKPPAASACGTATSSLKTPASIWIP